MISEKLKQHVKESEGLRLKPYLCPAGKLTIGYGHNIEDNGIPKKIAIALLDIDLGVAQDELFSAFPAYKTLTQNRIDALIDMSFNLGIARLKKFKRMHKAIADHDYEIAARELMDSHYARQVGKRAEKNRDLIING